MKLSLFIANRISKEASGSFSVAISRIAVFSTALGLAVLILSSLVLRGFNKEIKDKLFSFSGHVVISKYTHSNSYEQTPVVVTDSLMGVIKSYKYTQNAYKYALKAGLLKTDDEVQGVIIKGVSENFDVKKFSAYIIEGRFIMQESQGYSKEIVLSKKIATYLQLGIGDEVVVYFVQSPPRFRKLTIVGLYQTNLEDIDENMVLGDINLIRRMNGWNATQAGGVEVFLKESEKMEEAQAHFYNSLGYDLFVNTVENVYLQIFEWQDKLLARNVAILLTIILIVIATGMISITLISVMQKTSMIGILKALGASNQLIRNVFVWEGMRLSFKGLLLGNLIGLSLAMLQYHFKVLTLDPTNYYMSHVPINFDLPTVLGLNILITLVVFFTLFIPVSFITYIRPIRAIKFD